MSTRRQALSAVRVAGAKGAMLVLFVSAAALLAITSVAYACTGKASLYDVTPSSGQPGATVTVEGENYHDGEVEIRWDDAEGQLLGTAQGPSFTKQVTIPEAEAGNYAMVGIAYDALTGEEEGRDAKPFRVLSGDDPANDSSGDSSNSSDDSTSQSSASGDPSQDSTSDDATSQDSTSDDSTSQEPTSPEPSSQNSPSQEPSSEESTSPEPSSQNSPSQEPSSEESTSPEPTAHDATSQEPSSQESTSPEPSSNGARENTATGPSEPREQPRQPQSNQGATPSDQGSSAQATVTEPAAEDDDAAASETTGDPDLESEGLGGLATTPEARRPEARSSEGNESADETTNPSSRTGSQDLWGGLSSGEDLGRAPSLDEPSAEGELAGAGQHLAVAAGLLGAGLVLLMGGVLVAAMRRRTLATADRRAS